MRIKIFRFFLLVLFYAGVFNQPALSQFNPEFIEARVLALDDFYNNQSLRLSPLRYSNDYISRFTTRVLGTQSADLSLGSSSETHTFETASGHEDSFHSIYRVHDSLTLSESFTFPVSISGNYQGTSGPILFSKGPNRFVVKAHLDTTASVLSAGDELNFQYTSDEYWLTHQMVFDNQGSLLHERKLFREEPYYNYYHSLPIRYYDLGRELTTDTRITDFNYQDTAIVVESGVSDTIYSENLAYVIGAQNSDGTEYEGELEYSGEFRSVYQLAIDEYVDRMYYVRGQVDLDPTAQEAMYSTPANEYHLVLSRYNPQGSPISTQLLSKVEIVDSLAGHYTGKLRSYGDQILVSYEFLVNDIGDTIPDAGTFYALNNESIVESGGLSTSGSGHQTPRYSYLFNNENSAIGRSDSAYF